MLVLHRSLRTEKQPAARPIRTQVFRTLPVMAPTSQRVLVVGATGMLGSLVAKEAAAKGHRVTALVSERSLGDPGKKSAIDELTAAGVELAKGSLDSPQSVLVELAKKADVVRACSCHVLLCACVVRHR